MRKSIKNRVVFPIFFFFTILRLKKFHSRLNWMVARDCKWYSRSVCSAKMVTLRTWYMRKKEVIWCTQNLNYIFISFHRHYTVYLCSFGNCIRAFALDNKNIPVRWLSIRFSSKNVKKVDLCRLQIIFSNFNVRIVVASNWSNFIGRRQHNIPIGPHKICAVNFPTATKVKKSNWQATLIGDYFNHFVIVINSCQD